MVLLGTDRRRREKWDGVVQDVPTVVRAPLGRRSRSHAIGDGTTSMHGGGPDDFF